MMPIWLLNVHLVAFSSSSTGGIVYSLSGCGWTLYLYGQHRFFFLSSAGVSHSLTGCCYGGLSALKPTLSCTFRLSISLELVARICCSNTFGVKMLCLRLRNRAFCMRFRVDKLVENFSFVVLGSVVYVGACCAALCPLSKQSKLDSCVPIFN